jgi:carbon starvation protein
MNFRPLKILIWLLVSGLLVLSLYLLSVHRNEEVDSLWIVVAGICSLMISYRFYASWIFAKIITLEKERKTPAHTMEDGKDYVPTTRWLVFGHHFAAIAGPGPLVGPVLAAQFGYLPGTLWILVGATLGGAVHDALILFASIRRKGKSLAEMIKEEIGAGIGLICSFATLTILIILLAVLGLVVVRALAESSWGLFTIAMTIPIAFVMGLGLKFAPKAVGAVTVFGIVGLGLSVWGGHAIQSSPEWSAYFLRSEKTLAWTMMAYGLAASSLPMWMLLTPRDYLSTFMKLGTAILLMIAVVLLNPPLKMPAITSFVDGTGLVVAGTVFPFLFITIACGAISGFHALIASGTTPKIIDCETLVKRVGYGAMVVEMMVALMALVAASSMEPGHYFAMNVKGKPADVVAKVTAAGYPVTEEEMKDLATRMGEHNLIGRTGGAPTFAVGMAEVFAKAFKSQWVTSFWYHFAIMFEALFILTTIDAGTRVGRFLLQDLLGKFWKPLGDTQSNGANLFSSFLLVSAWGYFLYQGVVDPYGGINSLWPIFGIANQLLAVIGFCLATTLLIHLGKTRYIGITVVPLVFLVAVTFSAGWLKIFDPHPRIGFLASAAEYERQLAVAVTPENKRILEHLIFNQHLNVKVIAVYLILVAVIVTGCSWKWLNHRKTSFE